MPGGYGRLALVADVDVARRIVAHEHDREPRQETVALLQERRLAPDLRPDVGRERLAVDDDRIAHGCSSLGAMRLPVRRAQGRAGLGPFTGRCCPR